ncbi:MAG: phospho-sugar mutase [Bacteroidetes bacterium]|nr:phospho-sugar mutase [Bacteroidota bacterium]
MKDTQMLNNVREKAIKWLENNYDSETKASVKEMLDNNESELIESFYKDLEFGTGGLRGIMGAGTNRMNIYTVGMATQGLSNYIKKVFANKEKIKVAIAHDNRNNSRLFAETTSNVFTANGFKVFLFDTLRPTPELSFAIRHFKCQSGVVITASHNPKEYNGYKVYWEDGGQIILPHDKNIINEVKSISSINEVLFDGKQEDIEIIGEKIDNIYLERIKSLSLSPEVIERNNDLKIVYTPIHGTGVKLVPMALREFGFRNIFNVPEQDVTDGNFPTVKSPNPEETAAMEMSLKKARETDADLVMATDPDGDRMGAAIKDKNNRFKLLNGNQTGTLLIYYLLNKWAEKGKLHGKEYIVKTIVTSDLPGCIAEKYNVEYFNVLTGFKYIADIIRKNENKKVFIGGGEESYGFLAGEFVRDKDAVISCALLAETAAWAKDQGKTLNDLLIDIYLEFGFFKERLHNIVKKGKAGAEEIQNMMKKFRNNPPSYINNSQVIEIYDYQKSIKKNIVTKEESSINLPQSDVLQYILKDGSKISIRPSGTEPKIKFYFGVRDKLDNKSDFETIEQKLEMKIEAIIKSLNIN